MAAHPIQVLRHKCAFTHAQNKERNTKACVFRTSTCSFNLFLQNSKWASHSARTHLHTMHMQRSSLVIGRVRWLESRLSNVEEIREASSGHRVTSAKENIGRFYVVYKGMKSWWEKGCVVQLPPPSHSLSLIHTFPHKPTTTSFSPNMRIQNHLFEQQKMASVSYILVSNKRKKETLCRLVY